MTRKSVFALAAILALGSLSLATDASAEHGGGGRGGGGGHFGGASGGHWQQWPFWRRRRWTLRWWRRTHCQWTLRDWAWAGPPIVAGRGPGPGIHVAPGYRAHAFVAGEHRRHFWHGRWWYYGVGPCWVWSDYYGEYVWACG